MVKLLQINVDRRRTAHDLMFQTAAKEEMDIVVVSDPNKAMTSRKGCYTDESKDACIYVRNTNLKISAWGRGRGHVWIRTRNFLVVGVYISPNVTEEAYTSCLQSIQDSVIGRVANTLLGGEFNAKSHMWGSATKDRRGLMLADWAANNNLVVMNVGNKPTFQREDSSSIIDITFATERAVRLVTGWEVMEEETLSLHNYIRYEAKISTKSTRNEEHGKGILMIDSFREAVRGDPAFDESIHSIEDLVFLLRTAQDKATVQTRSSSQDGNAY